MLIWVSFWNEYHSDECWSANVITGSVTILPFYSKMSKCWLSVWQMLFCWMSLCKVSFFWCVPPRVILICHPFCLVFCWWSVWWVFFLLPGDILKSSIKLNCILLIVILLSVARMHAILWSSILQSVILLSIVLLHDGKYDIDNLVFHHRFQIMSPKFQEFERVQSYSCKMLNNAKVKVRNYES